MSKTNALFARRQRRTRHALRQAAGGRPRLSVFRSGKNIYAQVIDDKKGATLASASSLDVDVKATVAADAPALYAPTKGKAARNGQRLVAPATATKTAHVAASVLAQPALASVHDTVVVPGEQPAQQGSQQVHPSALRGHVPVENDPRTFSFPRQGKGTVPDQVAVRRVAVHLRGAPDRDPEAAVGVDGHAVGAARVWRELDEGVAADRFAARGIDRVAVNAASRTVGEIHRGPVRGEAEQARRTAVDARRAGDQLDDAGERSRRRHSGPGSRMVTSSARRRYSSSLSSGLIRELAGCSSASSVSSSSSS